MRAMRRQRWLTTFIVPLASVAATCGFAGTAAAAQLPGLQRVTATSATNSLGVKSVTASCPSSYHVLSAAGDIEGGLGEVVMDDITPNAALTSVTVTGFEDQDGTTNNWSLRAYAICSRPPAGLQRLTQTSATNSIGYKDEWSPCWGGQKALGGGGEITGGLGQVRINSLLADMINTSNEVIAIEDQDGTANNWSLNAYTICADPLAGLDSVWTWSANDSVDGKSATAICPANKKVVGAMGIIREGTGQITMDDVPPNAALTTVTVTGFEDQDGTANTWRADAFAICAFP